MTKSKTTKDIEKILLHKYDAITNHCAFEVKIGFSKSADQITKYVEIVDFIIYQNDGTFRCFEIKSSKADFLSGQRLSFYGDYNYLVIPKNLLPEIENCDLFKSLLWKGIGILLVNIESAEIEVYRKPKKKTWNLGMKNILIESMVRSLARDAKKILLKRYEGLSMSEHVKDKKFVITGRLATFSRDEAIELIKKNGGVIQPMVTPKKDYLVKGYFQLDLFNEDKKTRKVSLAEQLISKGYPIMIISEHSFLEMMK